MAQPEKMFHIGSCFASVFVNKTKDSKRSFRSVTLQRRYKEGDEWKRSTNFGLNELPAAIAVMQIAMNYVATQDTATSS